MSTYIPMINLSCVTCMAVSSCVQLALAPLPPPPPPPPPPGYCFLAGAQELFWDGNFTLVQFAIVVVSFEVGGDNGK